MAVVHRDGFSSAVRIYLAINGAVCRVAQVGENSLILRDKCDIKPFSDAHVIITVDGERRVYPVILRTLVNGNVWIFDDKGSCNVTDYPDIASCT